MFGWKQKHLVTQMVEEYLQHAERCLLHFREAFEMFFQNGFSREFSELSEKTDLEESACDDLRRRIDEQMYEKALIPESREDILHLLDKMDKIPNRAERILHDMLDMRIHIPSTLREGMLHLVHLNQECFTTLLEAVRGIFVASETVIEKIGMIGHQEEKSDRLERELIRAVFSDHEIPPDRRILLTDLIRHISHISDLSEDVADILKIMTVKRMV